MDGKARYLLIPFLFWTLSMPSLGAEKEKNCLSDFVAYLTIDPAASTDLGLMKDLYENQFYLKGSPKEEIFSTLLTKSEPIKPVLEQIQNAILEKHPAIGRFLCTAIAEGILPTVTPNGSKIVRRTVHHIILLDRLIQEMVNHPQYAIDLDAFYHRRRREFGVSDDLIASTIKIFHATGSIFEVAKQKSVDIALEQNLKLRAKNVIEPEDLLIKNLSLKLNIGEARATDLFHRFSDNAEVATKLMDEPVKSIKIVGENRAIEQNFKKGWAPLYETWNLAFITGNLSDLNVLYPKLLIPTVIGAKEDDYLFRRVLALWVSINLYLFDRYSEKPRIEMPNATDLALLWGSINLSYANELEIGR